VLSETYVAGTPLSGGDTYIRMSAAQPYEPYRLFYTVQPPLASAGMEAEPNNTLATAQTTTDGYISGSLPGPSPSTDADFYRFSACKGDGLLFFLDEDPLRNATPIFGAMTLYDAGGNTITSYATNVSFSSTTPGSGLSANTPHSQGESFVFKAEYSGVHYLAVGINGSNTGAVGNGDYLLSISADCQRLGTLSSDASVTISDAPDPVSPGATIDYTITMTNAGPSTSRDMSLSTVTPLGTTFVAVSPPAGWSCTKPAVGATGPVTCTGPYLEIGSQTIVLTVRVANGTSNGTVITANANLSNCHPDPVPGNNAASTTTTVTTPGASLPAAGSDCYSSSLAIRVNLLSSFHPGGCTESIGLTGPVKIWRGDPIDPGDGRDEVPTVMGCYLLSGTSSTGACGLGSVLARPSTSVPSAGQVKSSTDTVIYPADARFDLVVAMDTASGALHTAQASRVTAVVTSVPPPPSSVFDGNGATHALYGAQENVVGDFEILHEVLDTPMACPCECSPVVSLLPDKQTVAMGIPTAGTGVAYDLARGSVTALAPDWVTSFATALCAQPNGGPSRLDALTPSANQLVWYLSRDGAFGGNGTYNECGATAQTGDHDAVLGDLCP